MKQNTSKRITIIVLPGSGKSTFANKLSKLLNIPVYHLDKLLFNGTFRRDQEEFVALQQSLVDQESWIIEGCSITTLEMRFSRAGTVIYFHLPRLLCIWRVCKRLFSHHHLDESGCLNGIHWPLIKYIWNFDRDKRQRIEDLRQRYPQVHFLVFHHSRDLENYLRN
jgi:adenylate kinase family enzyme